MKRLKETVAAILTLLLIASSVPLSAFADTAISGTTGDCTWTFDGTTLTISGNGRMADYYDDNAPWIDRWYRQVIIQDGVQNIGNYAFYGHCPSVITLPDSVTEIGDYAFSESGSTSEDRLLKSVTLSNNLTKIGDYAFYECGSLKSITIPEGVKQIGNGAFNRCGSLKSITIPESVKQIGADVLYGTEIYRDKSNWDDTALYISNCLFAIEYSSNNCFAIKEGTRVIADYVFYGFTWFTDITIPNSVISIGNRAFLECENLTGVTIPDSVTSIGDYAFSKCTHLTNITIPNSVTNIGEGTFSGCENLTSVTIPDSVTSIGDYAFSKCTHLKNITIPNGVTNIGEGSFSDCENLTSANIPDSVVRIGYGAFRNCTNFKRIDITDLESWCKINNESYGEGPVSYYTPLEDAHSLYLNGEKITDLVIPDGITEIPIKAFAGGDFESVTIPSSVTKICDAVFLDCNSLNKVNIEDMNAWVNIEFELESLDLIARSNPLALAHQLYLNGEEVTELNLSDDVNEIKRYAFQGCTGLTKVNLPLSVESIGGGAFLNCENLTELSLNGNADIGVDLHNAFEGCDNLKKLTYADGSTAVNSLGSFENKNLLETVVIPKTVTTIKTVSNGNIVLNSVVNVTAPQCIASGTYKLNALFPNCENLVIAEGVRRIGEAAFEGSTALKNVTVPDSVTTIGAFAFQDCTWLDKVIIPAGVKSIGEDAFYNCTPTLLVEKGSYAEQYAVDNGINYEYYTGGYIGNLTWNISNGVITISGNGEIPDSNEQDIPWRNKDFKKAVIESGVTEIGSGAFTGCENMKSISIPDTVRSIDSDALAGCSELLSIVVDDNNAVYHAEVNCLIDTNKKTLIAGCNTSVIPDDGSVTAIGAYAFSGRKLLNSIVIPSGVTSIGYTAFANCTQLSTVKIPSTVTFISDYVFCNCSALAEIVIPNGVEYIGGYVFDGCESLESITIPKSVERIHIGVFGHCNALKSIQVENGSNYFFAKGNCLIETSGGKIVAGCNSSVIPTDGSVKIIGTGSFLGLTQLSSIKIPDSVTKIGGIAFKDCTKLTEIIIPNSIEYINGGALENTGIFNNEQNWENGMLYVGDVLMKVTDVQDKCTIKNGIRVIADYAFDTDTWNKFSSVIIPDSVQVICGNAFTGNTEFIIYGKKGSYAEKFANARGISFIEVKCTHGNISTVGYTAATCKTVGYSGDTYCNDCHKIIKSGDTLSLDPTNHKGTTSIVNEKAPTCTGKGYTGDTKCDDCGAILAKGNETPALGHKAGSTVVTKATTAKDGKITKICAVCKKAISTSKIYKASNVKLSTKSYTYNGKVKTPTVTVKDSKGKTLKKNSDYTLSYAKGRKYVGKYAVKVTFKGNYSGTKTLYFTINPKGTKLSSVKPNKKQITAKWKSQKSQTSGYQVQYSISKNFKGAKTVTVNSNKTTSKTIKKLKGGKKYYVRVRTFKKVGGKKYYSSWSGSKTAKTKR